jgi:hypothetical protein
MRQRIKARASEFRDRFKAKKAGSDSCDPAKDPDTHSLSAQDTQSGQGECPVFIVK